MNVGKVSLVMLGGIAIGAFIGMLFAPEKVIVTQNKISKKRKDQVNKLRDRINVFLDSVTGNAKLLKAHPEDPAKNGKGKAKAEKLKQ